MHEGQGGERLTLYIRRADDDAPARFRVTSQDGLQAVYWVEAGFGYAMVGGIARAPLLEAARSVYHALER